MNKKKILIITSSSILIIIFLIIILLNIFNKNTYKKEFNGNNKDIKEIENYILDINSYKANIDINVKSNKNENNYKMIQEVKNNQYVKQITLEPEELKNLQIEYKDGNLEIKNTELNLSKIYKDYQYITSNELFLTDFISNYSKSNKRKIEIKNNEVQMQFENSNNKYSSKEILHINSETIKPEKLEIVDKNNNSRIYILYNEIELNI